MCWNLSFSSFDCHLPQPRTLIALHILWPTRYVHDLRYSGGRNTQPFQILFRAKRSRPGWQEFRFLAILCKDCIRVQMQQRRCRWEDKFMPMFPRAIFHSVDPHYSHSSVVRPFAFRGVDGRPPDERPLRIHRLRVLQLHPGRIATPVRRRHCLRRLIQEREGEDGSPSFDRLDNITQSILGWMDETGNSCEQDIGTGSMLSLPRPRKRKNKRKIE